MSQADDAVMMDLALRAAKRGRPSPNPHVGAVVVRDGRVIGVGHHERAGQAHAEVAALAAATEPVEGATLYVTFEPCNHHGRTPPCTEAILSAGIARVVIGYRDPAPHVPGAIERLRANGVEVVVGVREDSAREMVADFEKHITTGLPLVTLKAAVTLDGKMATRTSDSKWITGEKARKRAHQMRGRSDAILVGVGTVLADDPALTVRHVRGENPLRVVLDSALRTPNDAQLVTRLAEARTLIYHAPDADPARIEALRDAGVDLAVVERSQRGLDLVAVLLDLGRRKVLRVLVEGGPYVHGAMLDENLADRLAVFIAPKVLGDARAPGFAAGQGVPSIDACHRAEGGRWLRLGDDMLFEGSLRRG